LSEALSQILDLEEVVRLVRIAIHDADPISRAEARVALERYGLPASPQAILMAGRRQGQPA
jgi:hypothetical protein